jgi:hypothetical protein
MDYQPAAQFDATLARQVSETGRALAAASFGS